MRDEIGHPSRRKRRIHEGASPVLPGRIVRMKAIPRAYELMGSSCGAMGFANTVMAVTRGKF